MTPLVAGLTALVVLSICLISGIWIALALSIVGVCVLLTFTQAPVMALLATSIWDALSGWSLIALPLFIWMGEILLHTDLSSQMYEGVAPWLNKLPGRLLHVNVISSGIFAAVSGSSAATTATIGQMAIPELTKRKYPESIAIGSLAGAGTLGFLIPPSIIMIVYGVSADQSIAALFIAGIIPGVLLMCLFSGYIIVWSLRHKDEIPVPNKIYTLKEKLYASRKLLPVVSLVLLLVGGLYGGVMTATEAGAMGVLGALILAYVGGSLTKSTFLAGAYEATYLSALIIIIIAGASFLTLAMGFTRVPQSLASWIAAIGLGKTAIIGVLTIVFIILGCLIDGISIIVLTASILLPMVKAVGIDLIWFGIYLVLVVEMAQITPPVGFNLFVLQGITGRDLLTIAKYAFPFFCVLVLMVVLVTAFPGLVTVLPRMM